MSRPIVALIDIKALQQNLSIVKTRTGNSRVWAVVKANAYGHGLQRILPAIADADGAALLNLEEAILLRQQGWQKPILLLEGFFQPQELSILDQHRLTTVIHSEWQINALAKSTLSAPLNVYLKVNSGMNRLGFAPHRVADVWQQLSSLTNVNQLTLMSHFANADKPEGIESATRQMTPLINQLGCSASLANSAATLWHPATHHQWVRPGVILYGASPTGRLEDIAETGLTPVMTLKSELIAIQTLLPGATVGYGSRYQAQEKQRIGVVACGYADGYPRHAPTGTPILVDGILTRTVGTVSMDMLTVDLTPCPAAAIGSPVELWGETVKIDQVAQAAGTVGYELMTALAARVPVRKR
ncbi:MAG: Alanine racemase, catabolic [Candidatus Erwinia impunctatus]|nr:Alanine racemase, catabolic [Culicoides impunctatus]